MKPNWNVPDSTRRGSDLFGAETREIQWIPDAVRRLVEDAEWALTSNPTGAAEIAGLLLGKNDTGLAIWDCQPLFLMHARERAGALAGPGKREFERAIAAFRSTPQEGLSVLGFYRCEIEGQSTLTEEDLGLLRASFQETRQLVLLVTVSGDQPSGVALFSGDQGEALSEFHCSGEASGILPRWLELWQALSPDVPADAARGAESGRAVHTGAPEGASTPAPAPSLPETPVRPAGDEDARGVGEGLPVGFKGRFHRRPVFLVATAILALAVAYPVYRGSARLKQGVGAWAPAVRPIPSGGSHESGLALRTERSGDDLQLDWNRAAPVLANVSGGILTIREKNAKEKQVLLDGNLLRTGSILYGPVHGDVFLRLVLLGQDGAKLNESVTSYAQGRP